AADRDRLRGGVDVDVEVRRVLAGPEDPAYDGVDRIECAARLLRDGEREADGFEHDRADARCDADARAGPHQLAAGVELRTPRFDLAEPSERAADRRTCRVTVANDVDGDDRPHQHFCADGHGDYFAFDSASTTA